MPRLKIEYKLKHVIIGILLTILSLLFLYDVVMTKSGYKTLIVNLHPVLITFSHIYLALIITIVILRSIQLLAQKRWKKAIIFLLLICMIAISSKVAINILTIKSQTNAIKLINEFLSTEKRKFNVQIKDEVKESYSNFRSSYNSSLIELIKSYPHHRRYDFIAKPVSSDPFVITLWITDKGGDILIHKPNY